MRNEQQMMSLILNKALHDDNIRAVIMNGSRVNPNAPVDCFMDYDIVYVVDSIGKYTADHSWVDIFGERIIMQMPDDNELFGDKPDNRFAYLMQFADGNRIDLSLVTVQKALADIQADSLTKVLLDKDNMFSPLPTPNDSSYWVKKPTNNMFKACCNEFWWVIVYVGKGIWRDELPYAFKSFDITKNMLKLLISWYIAMDYDFNISTGKFGKYFKKYLCEDIWTQYCKTYSNADYINLWEAFLQPAVYFLGWHMMWQTSLILIITSKKSKML